MNLKKTGASLLTGMLCIALLGGCAEKQKTTQQNESETVSDTNTASEFSMESQDRYEDQILGLIFRLPKTLMERMDNKEVAMLSDADIEGSTINYAFYTWNIMTKEQREEKVSIEDGYDEWAAKLERIGTLGICHKDKLNELDKLTKCNEHKELGKSEDGVYTYFLSTNQEADQTLTEEVKQITAEFTKMVSMDEFGAKDGDAPDMLSLGEFSLEDITGTAYTNEMFQDYKLTMINVFTTWCTPCINEIPDLEKLHQEMKEHGVNVIGIVLDAADEAGNKNEESLEKAKLLAERTGATYPFLIPDAGALNGRLKGIEAVPETFFVDKDGTIVGKTYSGSHSLEDWKTIVQTQLDGLKGDES